MSNLPVYLLDAWRDIALYPVGAGWHRLSGARRFRRHARDHWMLYAVQSGSLTISNDRFDLTAGPDQVVLIPPDVGFNEQAGPGPDGYATLITEFHVVSGPGRPDPLALLALPAVLPLPRPREQWQRLERVLTALGTWTNHRREEPDDLFARPWLELVLFAVVQHADPADLRSPAIAAPPRWLAAFIGGLDLKQRPTLAALAKRSGFSIPHLNRMVRRHYGVGLQAWLRRERMRAAGRVLAGNRDLPVAEIAARFGYDNPTVFARHFRAAHHLSPRMWRRSAEVTPALPRSRN